ncbi:MAG: hypothetical protein QNK05_00615 [Myxococcota bacterium]|nr:hypothetical protein [Myxococcota bacterium]
MPAAAVPVTHTIQSGPSSLAGDVSGSLGITVNTNLGSVSGSANAAGSLSSNPDGTISVDWGTPWSGSLDAGAGDVNINVPSPGSANGSATLDLFGFIPVNFDLTIGVDNITLGVAGSGFSAPTTPVEALPGSGPWASVDTSVDLLLGAQVDFNATGPFGISFGTNDIVIGPASVPGALAVGLSRTGPGALGTGSQLDIPIPGGLSLSIGPLPNSNIAVNSCVATVPGTSTCALNVNSVDVQLTNLTLSNLSGLIVATQTGTVIAEPATLGLLAAGVAGLLMMGRRRKA